MTKFVNTQAKLTPLKSTSELVEKFTGVQDKEFDEIRNFMGSKMNQ
jgi:hypothetical protein